MTDTPTMKRVREGLKRRYRSEKRFQSFGILAIVLALGFLVFLLANVFVQGMSAFRTTEIAVQVYFDPMVIDPGGTREREALSKANYRGLVRKSLRDIFPDVKDRQDKRRLYKLLSTGAGFNLRKEVLDNPGLIGKTLTVWMVASDDVDMAFKNNASFDKNVKSQGINAKQSAWLRDLKASGQIRSVFNKTFFLSGDSREPELAGIGGAVMGSLLSLAVTLAISFPLGAMTAVYLEEFAPKNRWTEIIEVNINNLASVPSIIFGLLGLSVFLNVFNMNRSSPMVGGLVLALMTLPTVIIAGRAALKSVPPSIREAALSVGASPLQAVFHHVLPLSMPGMLTGAIIGMARALGETAPLLMIGMVAFIVDVPKGFADPATALPVQIFLWADSPERAFEEKTAAAIVILLAFLICMNLIAVIMRKKFERKW